MQPTSSPPTSDSLPPGSNLLVPRSNNFVERPWGGTQLRELKALCPIPDQVSVTGAGLGESFELAAFDDDREAAAHPSLCRGAAGAQRRLPDLIREHAAELLGDAWLARYGPCIPLLPKFLNVRQLLSVQGHPPGHTEAYVVVDAEPGATIRLGFSKQIDSAQFGAQLEAGLREQHALAALLGEGSDWHAIQHVLSDWFANRASDPQVVLPLLREHAATLESHAATNASRLLEALKQKYWLVLDSMNEIELTPGQVIYNSNPPRIAANSKHMPAAEVHALGNPEGREFVMLEVRRPGPTLRAWDNVRYPMREVDVSAALNVLNLEATNAEEFIARRQPGNFSGHSISVDSPFFRIEHIEVQAGTSFEFASTDPHCLHVLTGAVEIVTNGETNAIELQSGESAFVPFGVQTWQGRALAQSLHLVKVHLP